MTLYKNGALVGGTPTATSIATQNARTLQLGASGGIGGLTGKIAIVQVYSRALSINEIKQNCLTQEHRFTATPQSICAAP